MRASESGSDQPTRRVPAKPHLAVFVATSGHSGVDRVVGNLLKAFQTMDVRVDLLRIRDHGPHLEKDVIGDAREFDLKARHVNTSLPELVRYLRRERPDVLLTDKYRVNRLAIIARALARTPTRLALRIGTTVSVNLATFDWLTQAIERVTFRWLYPSAEYILMPSLHAAEDLEALVGWPRGRVTAVPSPVYDAQRFKECAVPDHPWFTDPNTPVILGVGELSGRKDFPTLLQGFRLVREQRPARLVILGRGRARDALLSLTKELGIEEDVDLPGFVAEPHRFMAHAAVFALTSRWEGSPIVLMEALAAGVPVVSTDCPSGPREILENGRVGPLVAMGDHHALADRLIELLDDPPPRESLQAAAAKYEIHRSALAYLNAIGMSVPRSGPRT